MGKISPLGRLDLAKQPKAVQVWIEQVQRLLSESPIVAALSMDITPTAVPPAPDADVAYTQADIQAIVDLVNDLRDKQIETNALLQQIVTALGEPIGG